MISQIIEIKKSWHRFYRSSDGSESPIPRCSHTATVIGKFLYFIGGGFATDDDENNQAPFHFQHLDSIDVLNLEHASWFKIDVEGGDQFFTARRGHSAVLYEERYIVVFGGIYGETDDALSNEVLIFDTENRVWTKPNTSGTVPHPRRGHLACIHNSRMFIIGGFTSNSVIHEAPARIHILDLKTFEWSQIPLVCSNPQNILRAVSNACEVINEKLVFLGTYLTFPDFPFTVNGDTLQLITIDLNTLEIKAFSLSGEHAEELKHSNMVFHNTAAVGNIFIIMQPNSKEEADESEVVRLVAIDVDNPNSVFLLQNIEGDQPMGRNAASLTAFGNTLILFGGGVYPSTYFNTIHVLEFSINPFQKLFKVNDHEESEFKADDEPNSQEDIVTFSIEGREVCGRRSRLVRVSPVWAALLDGGFLEQNTSSPIDMNACGLSSDLFSKAIHGIQVPQKDSYNSLMLSDGEIFDLLKFSDMYEMNELKVDCERYFCEKLESEGNDKEILVFCQFAFELNCRNLFSYCMHTLCSQSPGSFWKKISSEPEKELKQFREYESLTQDQLDTIKAMMWKISLFDQM